MAAFEQQINGIEVQIASTRNPILVIDEELEVKRKLVEQNGGRAWVESEPGEGATFHFTWPRQFAEEEDT